MIPPPPFSRASIQSLSDEAREFLSEIKERPSLNRHALLSEVVG